VSLAGARIQIPCGNFSHTQLGVRIYILPCKWVILLMSSAIIFGFFAQLGANLIYFSDTQLSNLFFASQALKLLR
jgi:hypothetical protein